MPPDKIFIVQFADARYLQINLIQWARHYRVFPYQGEFNNDQLATLLGQIGYRNPISLEIFNDKFRSSAAPDIARDGFFSLQLLQECIDAASQIKFSMGSPPPFRGIEWLSFAVDEFSHAPLVALLENLGFKQIGTHKSKMVTLYQWGCVRCILNAEPDSFASGFNHLHGVSVYAFAVKVDDVEDAVARAKALRCEVVPQDRPGRWRIPLAMPPSSG